MNRTLVIVSDRMQRDYRYTCVAPIGRDFDAAFTPGLTPAEMLKLGVFCGKYMTDCQAEFPADWFVGAKLSPERRNCALNYFGVDASQPLSVWRAKGWIYEDDPQGHKQWKEREEKDKKSKERGNGVESFEKVKRYEMAAKRIW